MSNGVLDSKTNDEVNLSPSSSTSPSTLMNLCNEDSNLKLLEDNYEIQGIVDWVTCLGAKCIALQFPDELLADGPRIAHKIEHACNVLAFVIGDTSYGSCCVDETSALHVKADAIVHFGRACLSKNRRLPVYYVFEKINLECEMFLDAFKHTFDVDSQILIASDFKYHHSVKTLLPFLSSYHKLVYLEPDFPTSNNGAEIADCNFMISGRRCCFSPEEDVKVCYIGEEGATLTSLMLTLNRYTFYSYSVRHLCLRQEDLDVNQQLRKRYYLIEKARDAELFGILVATLGVEGYLDIIDQMKSLITKAGKKFYTVAVGKLNPSKLANFPEIDVFVIVSCPENSLLDSRDFYRPVITPFELELALNVERTWTGEYSTDFRQLMQPDAGDRVKLNVTEGVTRDFGVSLVSGRIQRLGMSCHEDKPLREMTDEKQLVETAEKTVNALPGASVFLKQQRGWHGLEPQVGETPIPSLATLGRQGLASGYSNEMK